MPGRGPGRPTEGDLTIAIATERVDPAASEGKPRRRRRRLKRVLIASGSALLALILLAAAWIGFSLYRIDHAVHHVGVPASLLAKGKNDLLAIVKGPNHSEQIFVFHNAGAHTNVLQIPKTLGLPLADGRHRPDRHAQPARPDAPSSPGSTTSASRSPTTSASTCTWSARRRASASWPPGSSRSRR